MDRIRKLEAIYVPAIGCWLCRSTIDDFAM